MTDVFFWSAAARAVAPASPMPLSAAVQYIHDPKAPRVSVTIQTERARTQGTRALSLRIGARQRGGHGCYAAACPSAPDPPIKPTPCL